MSWLKTIPITSAVALALSACGGGAPTDGTEAALGSAEILPTMETAQWSSAPAGCEGSLRPELKLAIADSAFDLVGAYEPEGRVVCVDTFAAIEGQLRTLDPIAADRFEASYVRTLLAEATIPLIGPAPGSTPTPIDDPRDMVSGDPDPQPNGPRGGGDPASGSSSSTMTSDPPEGDPDPQPNDPYRPTVDPRTMAAP
jgi:hypothetical protein